MCTDASTNRCFLVEWYQPDLAAVSFEQSVEKLQKIAESAHVRLLGALTAPSDETIYGVVAADSAEAAIDACRQAGWHTDRVTPVTRANIPA